MKTSDSYDLKIEREYPKYFDSDNNLEIEYWSNKLKCSREELMIAAKEVGPKLNNIRQFITMINVTMKRKVHAQKNIGE